MCKVWLKLAHWFSRRGFFILSMYFRYFVINKSPWNRAGSFIWTNFKLLSKRIPFNPGCFVPSLVKIGPLVLEKIFLKYRIRIPENKVYFLEQIFVCLGIPIYCYTHNIGKIGEQISFDQGSWNPEHWHTNIARP